LDFSIRVTNGKLRKLTTGLVLHVFGDDDASVVKNEVFPGGSSLSAQTYSSSTDVQKFITLRLFIVSRHGNKSWKEEIVFYNYCIGLPVIFQTCQRQNCIFLTAACSQVRFDVGVRSFRFEVFLGDSTMDTYHGASTS
jgi:hypothetical protein